MNRWLLGILTAALFTSGLICEAAADNKEVELQIGGKTALADLVVPEDKTIKDGVLILVHGTLAHKDMELVGTLQRLLAERGIATLAHTLTLGLDRREGMYDCTQPHTHSHQDAIREIGAWVKWLKKQGAEKIFLAGHSRGGNQAAWYAAEHGTIEKVMLLAPTMGNSAEHIAASYKKRFKADLKPLLEEADRKINMGDGKKLMDLPGFIYCPNSKAAAASVKSYYGAEPRKDTTSLLTKIVQPVLVIAGSADTVVPDVADKVRTIADGKKVKLNIIENADHMFLDFYAEDAADLISEFLSK